MIKTRAELIAQCDAQYSEYNSPECIAERERLECIASESRKLQIETTIRNTLSGDNIPSRASSVLPLFFLLGCEKDLDWSVIKSELESAGYVFDLDMVKSTLTIS